MQLRRVGGCHSTARHLSIALGTPPQVKALLPQFPPFVLSYLPPPPPGRTGISPCYLPEGQQPSPLLFLNTQART